MFGRGRVLDSVCWDQGYQAESKNQPTRWNKTHNVHLRVRLSYFNEHGLALAHMCVNLFGFTRWLILENSPGSQGACVRARSSRGNWNIAPRLEGKKDCGKHESVSRSGRVFVESPENDRGLMFWWDFSVQWNKRGLHTWEETGNRKWLKTTAAVAGMCIASCLDEKEVSKLSQQRKRTRW